MKDTDFPTRILCSGRSSLILILLNFINGKKQIRCGIICFYLTSSKCNFKINNRSNYVLSGLSCRITSPTDWFECCFLYLILLSRVQSGIRFLRRHEQALASGAASVSSASFSRLSALDLRPPQFAVARTHPESCPSCSPRSQSPGRRTGASDFGLKHKHEKVLMSCLSNLSHQF